MGETIKIAAGAYEDRAETANGWKARIMKAARTTGVLLASGALAVAVSACGSGASSSTSSANTASTPAPAAASTQASTPTTSVSAPTPHLTILSPRAGGHTGSTLTVRVAATGAPSGSQRFRYVLDGHFTRSGSTHVTFHELAPGVHRLEVAMLGSSDHANTTFIVNAPAPAPAPAPAAVAPHAAETPPTTTTPAPAAAPTPGSQAPHKAPAPKPAPPAEKAPAPPAKTAPSGASEGIPQGPGAGDGDGDNHGEPSDGDGNI
jgi:hypothetical protein